MNITLLIYQLHENIRKKKKESDQVIRDVFTKHNTSFSWKLMLTQFLQRYSYWGFKSNKRVLVLFTTKDLSFIKDENMVDGKKILFRDVWCKYLLLEGLYHSCMDVVWNIYTICLFQALFFPNICLFKILNYLFGLGFIFVTVREDFLKANKIHRFCFLWHENFTKCFVLWRHGIRASEASKLK